MLLSWLGRRRDDARLQQAADAIEAALDAAIARPECRTRDMGGTGGNRRIHGGRRGGNRDSIMTKRQIKLGLSMATSVRRLT